MVTVGRPGKRVLGDNAEADPEEAELNLIDPLELEALLNGTLEP